MTDQIIFSTKGGGAAIGQVVTGATEGSVLFAGAGGVLAQDNANFFWDDTNNGLFLETDTVNTLGAAFTFTGDSLGLSNLVRIQSASASTSARNLLNINNSNALATGAIPVAVSQASTGPGIQVLSTGDGPSIRLVSTATTASVLDFFSTATTTGTVLDVSAANSLTTGMIADFTSNSADVSARNLVQIVNENSGATGATPLHIRQDAAANAMFIDQNGDASALVIDTESTSLPAVNVLTPQQTTGDIISIQSANSLTTGSALNIDSNSADASIRYLIDVHNDSASATQARGMRIIQDSIADALYIDKNAQGNAIHVEADISSVADQIGILADVSNTGTGASIALHATAGHVVVGNPTTNVTNRSIHTFGTNNGIQLERVAGEEGIMQVQSGSVTGGIFTLEGTGDMLIGQTDEQIYIDRSASQILMGDPFGDGADVHVTIDNATGYVTTGGDTTIGSDTAPTASLMVDGDIAVKRTATAVNINSAGETIIGVTDTTVARTITLDSDDVVDGQIMIIKDESGGAGTNNITIATEGAETIDGNASIDITVDYGTLRVYSNGTNWFTF